MTVAAPYLEKPFSIPGFIAWADKECPAKYPGETHENVTVASQLVQATMYDKQRRHEPFLPAITHPVAVYEVIVKRFSDFPAYQCAALLHDIIEETKHLEEDQRITAETLRKLRFSETIIAAVQALSHLDENNVPYLKYGEGVSCNEIACQVKLADLEHNMSDLADKPECAERLYKYKVLRAYLQRVSDDNYGTNYLGMQGEDRERIAPGSPVIEFLKNNRVDGLDADTITDVVIGHYYSMGKRPKRSDIAAHFANHGVRVSLPSATVANDATPAVASSSLPGGYSGHRSRRPTSEYSPLSKPVATVKTAVP